MDDVVARTFAEAEARTRPEHYLKTLTHSELRAFAFGVILTLHEPGSAIVDLVAAAFREKAP